MARFLFVVPPLTGHVNPTISVARALEDRGHQVAWVGHPGAVCPLLPTSARLFALSEHAPAELVAQVTDRARTTRGAAALKFLWEDFLIPLARQMRPGIEGACDEFAPDVMICDQQAVAGSLVARRRGLPWATLATTSAGVTEPLAGLPEVARWLRELYASLEREAELEPAPDGERSPHLVIAFTTEAMVGPRDQFPAHYRFVGPSFAARPETTPFPWEALAPGPRVLISMGTVNAESSGRFFATTLAAFADPALAGVQGILVAPAAVLGDAVIPPNVIVRPYVPQLALLAKVDAVVSHGGHNTVCETLANGTPLVVAPIRDDQPIVADQVVAAGAGVRVKFGRVQAPELRAAIRAVLDDPSYRAAALRVRDSFAAAGGPAAAAALLEGLS
ncbi:MAG: glycosyltransferase [Deltaproteobacteria bacterium]|nr:glycosyltransferase [Deltaproteobacteria bacterium]